jgi:rubredoxin
MNTDKPLIVSTEPKPLPRSVLCPGCGSGKDKREASGGFGALHPICSKCGHEFIGEKWNG